MRYLGFSIMGNQFHGVVRMHTDDNYSDENVCKRFALYYQNDKAKRAPMPNQIPTLREKWGKLSEFMKAWKK